MTVPRHILYREAKALAILIALGTVQSFFLCHTCNGDVFTIVWFFTVLLWILLWKGNIWITLFLDEKISWIRFPGRRFLAGILSAVVYTCVVLFTSMAAFEKVFSFKFGSSYAFTVNVALGLTVFISLFTHSKRFLSSWKYATLEKEKLSREKIAASYEQLKTRINPTLLFESLHSLRGLVAADKDNAVKFIKHLSEVYRYILDTREKELVSGEKELKFLQSFVFLLKVRFNDALQISLNWNGKFEVTPLAVQLILEALLEGNSPGIDSPMEIGIASEEGFVRIEANSSLPINLSPEFNEVVRSLRERYSVLSGKEIDLIVEPRRVAVALPWITKPWDSL